uniref:Ribonuclease P protein subunit p29 n=1 Tax=Leptobrachium leishanense TaxID=445787 RepID=A0A8C5PPM5_9ANUR
MPSDITMLQPRRRRQVQDKQNAHIEKQALEKDSKGVIYKTLPPEEAKHVGLEVPSTKKAEAFVNAFLKQSMPRMKKNNLQESLERKAVILEYNYKKKKRKRCKSKGLTAKEKRERRIFQINPENQRYELFLPLHELWKQYIRELCNGLKRDAQPQMIQTRLLKADLHGALVMVSKSKCPSYVGVTGIILQETKHVFKIITSENKLKVVPKLNCIFTVEIDGFISHIYGSKLQMRSSERSAKKFKSKGTIDL